MPNFVITKSGTKTGTINNASGKSTAAGADSSPSFIITPITEPQISQAEKASIRDNLRAKSVSQRRQELAGQNTNGMSTEGMPTYESVLNEPQISQALRTQQQVNLPSYESGQNEPNIMKAFREADAQNWLDNIMLLDSGAANDIEYKNLGQEASVKGTFLKMRADQLMKDYETLTHAGAVTQDDADSFNQRLEAFKKDAGDYNALLARIKILSGAGGNIVKDFHYADTLMQKIEDKKEELLNLKSTVASNWRTPETAEENRNLYDKAKAELNQLESEFAAWQADQDEQARANTIARFSAVSEAEDYEQAIAALDWDDIDMPLIGKPTGLNEKLRYATDEEYRAERDEERAPVYPELYYMTDDERDILSYYVSRGDYAKANEYLDTLEYTLNARKRVEDQAWQTAQAYEYPLLAALTTNAIGSWFSPFAYAATAVQEAKNLITGEDKPVDPNSFWFDGAHLVEDTREGVHNAVRDKAGDGFWGDAAAFGTDTGLSILQYASKLPLGPTGAPGFHEPGGGGADGDGRAGARRDDEAGLRPRHGVGGHRGDHREDPARQPVPPREAGDERYEAGGHVRAETGGHRGHGGNDLRDRRERGRHRGHAGVVQL